MAGVSAAFARTFVSQTWPSNDREFLWFYVPVVPRPIPFGVSVIEVLSLRSQT